MTNLIATVIIHVVTITNNVGTFTPATNSTAFDVIEERRQTNVVATIEYDGKDQEFLIKTVPGDLIRTRAEPKPPIHQSVWGGFVITNSVVNPYLLNGGVQPL